ncbi:MAG: acyl-CoA dehydrogenase family protein, partial [Nitratireductor sp.]
MNFLTPEQEMWRTTVARFIDEEIGRDYIRKCDREREYPYEAYEKVAKQGWLGILFSEESGGLGGDIVDYALMCEGLG